MRPRAAIGEVIISFRGIEAGRTDEQADNARGSYGNQAVAILFRLDEFVG